MSRRPVRALIVLLAVLAAPVSAGAVPRVVADIPPVHSITARVMAGIGRPELVVPPGVSPHGHALRPSEARRLQEAEVVVWIGPGLAPWLEGPLAALAPDAVVVELMQAPGLRVLPRRLGGAFSAAEDEAHGHGHDHDHGQDHDGPDSHVWLDPGNAVAIAEAVAAELGALDPANAGAYAANAAAFRAETAALSDEIAARLAPLRGRSYVVFHDAYRYFEAAFDLPAAGAIALGDADRPGAARLAAIRDRIRLSGAACVLSEPQFRPALAATAVEGTDARLGTLDPLGAGIEPGPDLYPELIRGLARDLAACLAPEG